MTFTDCFCKRVLSGLKCSFLTAPANFSSQVSRLTVKAFNDLPVKYLGYFRFIAKAHHVVNKLNARIVTNQSSRTEIHYVSKAF